MSKEYLEAFKNLKQELYYSPNQIPDIDKWHEIIEQALKRLEAIDNANPNRALECLEALGGVEISHTETEQDEDFNGEWVFDTVTVDDGPIEYLYDEYFNTIKDYILKTQQQEDKAKAFNLINEKDVDIKLLKWAYPSVEAYNVKVRTEKDYWWRKELTKEEFEFIGRLVGAK